MSKPPLSRRNFAVVAIHGIWAAMVAALAVPAGLYLLLPGRIRRRNDWVEAGDVSQLTPKSPLEMAFRRNRVDGWRVISEKSTAWVVKMDEKNIVAYSPQCTHLGCAYHWDSRKTEFICPCHNSVFAIDGKVLDGPAPRPLDKYEVKVEDNKLYLGAVQQSSQTV